MGSSADATLAYGIMLYDIDEEHEFTEKFFDPNNSESDEFDGIYEIESRVELPDTVEFDHFGDAQYGYTGGVLIIKESKRWAIDYGVVKIESDLIHGVDWNSDLLEAYQVLKEAAVDQLDLGEPAWLLYAGYG